LLRRAITSSGTSFQLFKNRSTFRHVAGFLQNIPGRARHAGSQAHDADAKEGGPYIEEIAFCVAALLSLFRNLKAAPDNRTYARHPAFSRPRRCWPKVRERRRDRKIFYIEYSRKKSANCASSIGITNSLQNFFWQRRDVFG
jgi:hypothetical protein